MAGVDGGGANVLQERQRQEKGAKVKQREKEKERENGNQWLSEKQNHKETKEKRSGNGDRGGRR